jgi:predicted DNA-binding protein with PD1-like motif
MVLEIGDELIGCLKRLAEAERIGEASFTAIGAVRDAVLAYLDPVGKEYLSREFGPESMELVSAIGNLARLEGAPAIHCHALLGDRELRVYGGHLLHAVTSVSVEVFVRVYDGEIVRRFDPETGANPIQL